MGNLQNINICCGSAEPVPVTLFQTPSSHYVDYVQELEKYKKMHELWAKSHNEKCPCGSGKLWKNCHGA